MPRRFIFRLQAVLERRQRLERERQHRVGLIERERLEAEGRLRACQSRIAAAKGDLRAFLQGGPVAAESLRMQAHASIHLEAQVRRTLLELAGIHKRLDTARAELARATASRRAVAMLRDKREAQWRRALAKREEAALDDLVVMRHARKDVLS